MLSHYRSVDAADYDVLYQYAESGQAIEPREKLDKICRECRLSSNQFKELLRAAERTGQISMIKLLLEHDPDYGAEFPGGELSALSIAILYGHLDSAELLVRSGCVDVSGADLAARDYRRRTVLHCAAAQGRVQETKLLLEKGADVNAANCEGETPLLAAAASSKADELLPLLMRHGADVTAKNAWGYNALHNLTYAPGEHVELARVLIEKGVSLKDRECFHEYQPIHIAVSLEKNELAKLYLDYGADFQARDCFGRSPLHYAASKDQVQVTEWLLEKGADPNVAAEDGGVTPLLVAARSSNADEQLPLLMRHGADVTAKNAWGYNALHNLAYAPGEHVELARVLIEKGVSLDDREGFLEYQPMHVAAFLEKYKMAQLYLDHGADLKDRDSRGQTVLHYCALRKDQAQVTEWLLEKGADLNIADNDGEAPLLAAIKSGTSSQADLLIKHGADVTARDSRGRNTLHLLSFAPKECVDVARVLIEKGVSLNDRSVSYQPLHVAIVLKKNKLVNLYLDHGADVNAPTTDGRFPLYLAVNFYDTRVLKTLLKRGANVNLRTTSKGYTAMHKCCGGYHPRDKSAALLLSAGADAFGEECNNGFTPFGFKLSPTPEEPIVRMIANGLAMKKDCQPLIELKGERILKEKEWGTWLWFYYQNCLKEIPRMKSTRFIETCSFYELLTKSRCEIAKLMRHREFESKFKLYDDIYNEFQANGEFLLRAFKRAKRHHQSRLKQEDVINEAVYYILPDIVVRKVVDYIFVCCSTAEINEVCNFYKSQISL